MSDDADFPIELLPLGERKIRHARIPFGVMRAEGVMREILAYCFLGKHGLPVHSTPLCVYEYPARGRKRGYCLVSETRGEARAEQFVTYPDRTVANIIQAQTGMRGEDAEDLVGSELNLMGLNLWWYVQQKSRLLSQMHFLGGFRGILNSNIGNDVVVNHGADGARLYLCDYDTFALAAIPRDPSLEFLDAFVLQCVVEVVKGSLSILQYVHLPRDAGAEEVADALGSVYFEKSSLWRAYERRFAQGVHNCGWSLTAAEKALKRACRTNAFADVVSGCVLNRHYLSRMAATRGVFYPHN